MCESIVVGTSGLIGGSIYSYLQKRCSKVIGTSRKGKYKLDLCEPLLDFDCGSIRWAIIAAGYANPKRCVENPTLCEKIDLEGFLSLCKLFREREITPIVFSTTQVFDGTLPMYFPNSPTSPINLYGQIHAEREKRLLRELNGECIILRLCRTVSRNSGVIYEVVDSLAKNGQVKAATDQILQMVTIEEVMDCVFSLQEKDCRGIYQICPRETVSRYELAKYIAKKLDIDEDHVQPISMADIDSIPRPKCAYLASCYPVKHWKEGVDRVVAHYRKNLVEASQGSVSR